mgnify:CR=1 FL=1
MTQNYQVGDTIRMPHYPTMPQGSFRVWKIMGMFHGSMEQESVCCLRPIDILNSTEGECIVPIIMLETHPLIERV